MKRVALVLLDLLALVAGLAAVGGAYYFGAWKATTMSPLVLHVVATTAVGVGLWLLFGLLGVGLALVVEVQDPGLSGRKLRQEMRFDTKCGPFGFVDACLRITKTSRSIPLGEVQNVMI